MIQRQQPHSKSMNNPFGLKLKFSDNRCTMRLKFIKHFLGIIESPCCIIAYIEIMLRFIIYSSFSTRNEIFRLKLCYFLLCLAHFLQVIRMLFLVNIKWEFIDAKLIVVRSDYICGKIESLNNSH